MGQPIEEAARHAATNGSGPYPAAQEGLRDRIVDDPSVRLSGLALSKPRRHGADDLEHLKEAVNRGLTAGGFDVLPEDTKVDVSLAAYARAQGAFIAEQQAFMSSGNVPAYTRAQETFLSVQSGIIRDVNPISYSQLLGKFVALQAEMKTELGLV